jgi:hypothetical protein
MLKMSIRIKICSVLTLASIPSELFGQEEFSNNPDSVIFHTEDIHTFWKVFDKTFPELDAKSFQEEYIDVGSAGLKGFIGSRIQDGENLSNIIRSNLPYYQAIRETSFSIDNNRERFHECFRRLKEIYPKAVFPDVYFVIGAKNSGGTIFDRGLIIGVEMFGKATDEPKPISDIEYIDEVVAHELVHFQQHYPNDNSLLAQCIREGAADFICELIAGDHTNKKIYEYGDAHAEELWQEFVNEKDSTYWKNWLYNTRYNTSSRPSDLGYWIGYKITEAYYDNMSDKRKAINDILNITDFNEFLTRSGLIINEK